jgi:NADPH:quinone reductase-like Zn-dependent oxidoreductase
MSASTDDLTSPETPRTMMAVVTTGTGGYDKLSYREVPVPELAHGEILLRVLAAGVNNTDINTRLGWYSASVTTGTDAAAEDSSTLRDDGGWNTATPFPLIQGADCCGRIVAVARDGDASTIGARVLVRACMRPPDQGAMKTVWIGSDFDGAFAQLVKVPAAEAFAVDCDWTDAELATIPCAYGTAENMLHRAGVAAGTRILIAGASGGVGSAAVQLARLRGAEVIGIAGRSKHDMVRSVGADHMVDRGADPVEALGKESVDVVVDNVAGPGFGGMLEVLKSGGTYVSSGAIAGPLVDLDMRTFYLKDLTLLGCTAWDEPVFPNLVSFIERGDIRPLLDRTYPLDQIATAQRDFLEKRHVGKVVLIPPA